MAEMPSMRALAKRTPWSAENPSCRAPVTAMAPVQKRSDALTNPAAKPACLSGPTSLPLILSARRWNPSSMDSVAPMAAPTASDRIMTRVFSPFSAPERPMRITPRPRASMTRSCSFWLMPL